MPEKRKFIRFGVLFDAMFRGNKAGIAKVSDFSRQGLGLITDADFQEGETLDIEMSIPGDNMPVLCQGEIAWVKPMSTEEMKNKCGVKIKKIEKNDRSRILEHIYNKWILSSDK